MTLTSASAVASDGTTACDRLREQDEDGIARRVRLMARDVEVADAEREVDRVEIFERRGRNGR